MKSKKFNRRKLLAGAGVLGVSAFSALQFDPVKEFLNAMVRGFIKDAPSKVLGNRLVPHAARNYVQFHSYGAPSRWFFDHVLRPTDKDAFLPCIGVFNQFEELNSQAPHLSKGRYSDVNINGINMPFLWEYDVARAGGGSRPMTDLLKNMLTIRGCDVRSNAHPISSAKLVAPSAGDVSITGLVADATEALIPAVSVGCTPSNRAYKSALGTGVVEIPSESEDYISFLLEIFSHSSQGAVRSLAVVDEQVENAISKLRAYSLTNNAGSEVLYHERRRTETLIRQGVKNLGEVFPRLVKKYDDLFSRSIHLSSIAGVTDKVIPGLKFPFSVDGDAVPLEAMATHHFEESVMTCSDIREMFATAHSQNLPQHFALAEFLLTEGLSSSIVLASPQERGSTLMGLTLRDSHWLADVKKTYDPVRKSSTFSTGLPSGVLNENLQNMAHDSHEIGWIANVVGCNLFYRGFSACMIELIDQLKAVHVGGGTLFDETVIHFATEFDRSPQTCGAQSGHNEKAHVTSLFSGIVNEYTLLGNIFVGGKKSQTQPFGTLGNAAPIKGFPGQYVTSDNISSTLSEMLRVPRIVRRAAALVKVTGTTLVPTVEPAKNVNEDG